MHRDARCVRLECIILCGSNDRQLLYVIHICIRSWRECFAFVEYYAIKRLPYCNTLSMRPSGINRIWRYTYVSTYIARYPVPATFLAILNVNVTFCNTMISIARFNDQRHGSWFLLLDEKFGSWMFLSRFICSRGDWVIIVPPVVTRCNWKKEVFSFYGPFARRVR